MMDFKVHVGDSRIAYASRVAESSENNLENVTMGDRYVVQDTYLANAAAGRRAIKSVVRALAALQRHSASPLAIISATAPIISRSVRQFSLFITFVKMHCSNLLQAILFAVAIGSTAALPLSSSHLNGRDHVELAMRDSLAIRDQYVNHVVRDVLNTIHARELAALEARAAGAVHAPVNAKGGGGHGQGAQSTAATQGTATSSSSTSGGNGGNGGGNGSNAGGGQGSSTTSGGGGGGGGQSHGTSGNYVEGWDYPP
ncbi:hypothetical protein EIP91_008053 [Steccherinum ochraceum]|uniref:Uncharacterized protein n=1 Tax=Steccherinum ochraceum TaxID=92696 RepID=A0A4R0RYF6_9APHY|nr:hypothetical protein EIP91_008053 [Steccherinum ochraceum]